MKRLLIRAAALLVLAAACLFAALNLRPHIACAECVDCNWQTCYDTYNSTAPDSYSYSGGAPYEWHDYTETRHDKVYFMDGYDRAIDPVGKGQYDSGLLFTDYCPPAFTNPVITHSSPSVTDR
jgi:hypothetical protein